MGVIIDSIDPIALGFIFLRFVAFQQLILDAEWCLVSCNCLCIFVYAIPRNVSCAATWGKAEQGKACGVRCDDDMVDMRQPGS